MFLLDVELWPEGHCHRLMIDGRPGLRQRVVCSIFLRCRAAQPGDLQLCAALEKANR